MKENSLSEQLIRLAYAEIILQHAEADSAETFVDNLQQDLASSVEQTEDQQHPQEEISSEESLLDPDLDPESISPSFLKRLQTKLKSDKKLIAGAIALIFILPFLLLLVWSNVGYKDKILPGTKYASVELSSNSDKALEQIKAASADYKYSLKFNESEKTYSADEVGVQLSPEDTLNAAKNQSNQIRFFARPFALLGSRNVQTVTHINKEKLRSFLESQNYSDKLPEDAKIEYNSDQSKFVVIPEIAGRGIDSSSFASRLENSAKDLRTEIIDLQIEDVKPRIISSDLNTPTEEANDYISQKIVLTSPNKNYTAAPEVIKDWLVLTPDPDHSTYQISLNEGSIKSYVDSVAKKVNQKMEKKLYATIDGSDLLLQEGQTGLQVTNVDDLKTQLAALVKAKRSGSLSMETKEESPSTENIAASGGRWIFADLSQFKIYAYEGAQLVNSFPMSSGKASTPTPTGRYSVMSKVRVKTMTSGGNKNSKDYYSVPNIEWVAYFKAGGYAMHGVYWHNKFGVENTSHGCMGMSNTNAKWVYDFVDIGTPVIIVS